MTTRNSTKDRRRCFDKHKREDHRGRIVLDCYLCQAVMDVRRDVWEAEHPIMHTLDGDEVLPVCVPCHKEKTKKDKTALAKGKRVGDFNTGIKRSRTLMPGGKNSEWKKTFANGWVKRDDDETEN